MSAALPDEIRPVMENGVPVVIATCAADGVPNVSIVSEVYYVDPGTIALSFQFFSKTIKNVRENPQAAIILNDIKGGRRWMLQVRYDHSETEGPIFDLQNYGIAVHDGSDLRLPINKALLHFRTTPEYVALCSKYFGNN